MNELRLKEYTADHIVYLYQPDGKGEWGEVAYLFADNEAKITKQSKDDEIGRYGYKAARKIEECVQKNNLPMKFIQAWG
jgi:GH35 family endo-1,4-beta-xylanase